MRIFVTHVLPEDEGLRRGISIAATKFSMNLISGGGFDKVYSILPPFINGKFTGFSDSKTEIVYNRGLRNAALSKLAAMVEQVRLFRMIPANSNVWLYNLTPLNGILVKLLHKFKPSVKIYAIILDFTPHDSKAERWLSEINSCDGRILLSMYNRFRQDNSTCLPGVTPLQDKRWPEITKPKKEFILSGQLSDNISLLSRLLPIFAKHKEWILNITGDLSDSANILADNHPNIRYHGKCTYDKFLEVLHRSPFLLSTRDPEMPENQCNFPSKIIEGLLHNRIIISTIDYPQLKPISYIKVDALHLETDLERVMEMQDESLLKYANQADIVKEKFNVQVWNNTMRYIEDIS